MPNVNQIKLNQFFDNASQAAASCFEVPLGEVFIQLRDKPAQGKLHTLRERTIQFNFLQKRLMDATTHQQRDRIIACIASAIMASLIAGIVLGILYCPPAAIACGSVLILLGFICSAIVEDMALKEKREGYWKADYSDVLPIGIPKLIYYSLTRKNAFQKAIEPLQAGIKTDLKEAGEYLQANSTLIQNKIENDIRKCQQALDVETAKFPLDAHTAAQLNICSSTAILDYKHAIKKQALVLQELTGKGQMMVERLQNAGIIPFVKKQSHI